MSGTRRPRPPVIPTRAARAAQVAAGDPARSVWVTANAGSGKTHVLAERVVRLLLSGVDPSRILCLTYTRVAAAAMREQIFRRLSALATADEARLAAALAELTALPGADGGETKFAGPRPAPAMALEARRLFARALETPGGLRIQTIHAFCETLLRRFPMEAGIAGHFELADGAPLAALDAEVRRDVFARAAGEGAATPLGAAFAGILARGGEDGLARLLATAAANRTELGAFIARVRADGGFAPMFAACGFAPGETEAALAAAVWPAPGLDEPLLRRALSARGQTDNGAKRMAGILEAAAIADPARRADALRAVLLTREGPPFASFAVKAVAAELPGINEAYQETAAHVIAALRRLDDHRLLSASADALTLVAAWFEALEAGKRRRGLLDFNDMIEAARRLLNRPGVAPWVRYKLDAGIDHILVDEAQDTSPAQWAVLDPLVEDLFSGAGDFGRRRSLFVVGDPKQSIYSFQGARPEGFHERRRAYGGVARRAMPDGAEVEHVEFRSSFRSAPAVLAGVDAVFAFGTPARAGMTDGEDGTAHHALRAAAPGRIDVWDPVVPAPADEPEAWHERARGEASPVVRLAQRLRDDIARRLASGEAAAGDILVLVRSRAGIVPALVRALKDARIPVAGADRLKLHTAVAVRDLLALARIVLQPADDLSLAALMKSPVFGLTDDDLLRVAPGRASGTTLLAAVAADPALRHVAEAVERWRALADAETVPGFFTRLLGEHGLRRRLAARLGPETDDILDEFLLAAADAARGGAIGLDAFIERFLANPTEIKRETEQAGDAVRIMTVHAAKGLEARHVYLVDGTAPPLQSRKRPPLASMPALKPALASTPALKPALASTPAPQHAGEDVWLWLPPAAAGNLADRLRAWQDRRAGEEFRRLLYVAMTRAEDTLTIAVHAGSRANPDEGWAAWVRGALAPLPGTTLMRSACGTYGLLRHEPAPQGASAADAAPDAAQEPAPESGPDAAPFAFPPLAAEPPLPRPLAPSVAALAIEADPPAAGPAAAYGIAVPGSGPSTGPVLDAGTRGTLMHALLQRLPDVPPDARPQAAPRLMRLLADTAGVDAFDGADALRPWAAALVAEALSVLDAPALAPLFAGPARSEAAIMGRVRLAGGERLVTGVIDRIVDAGDAILLIDFKTGRPPSDAAGAPQAHVAQVALYGLLAAAVFPGRPLRGILVYTAGPRLIEVPDAMMREALDRLGAAPLGPG